MMKFLLSLLSKKRGLSKRKYPKRKQGRGKTGRVNKVSNPFLFSAM